MQFGMTEEQSMIVDTTRAFVTKELYPHELEVERSGHLPMELVREIQAKAIEAGLYAANMPEEVGGAGLDTLTWLLYEKELGRANYALHWTSVARPSNILLAGTEEQKEKYLFPCIRGEKWDCLAMTEPGAGSDLRGMAASARKDGDDWILNGTKHFISHADVADFAIVFMATGEEDTPRGKKKKITAFFVDKGTPGFEVRAGYGNVSHRGYTNAVLEFDDCRLPSSAILGEVDKGFVFLSFRNLKRHLQVVVHRYQRILAFVEVSGDDHVSGLGVFVFERSTSDVAQHQIILQEHGSGQADRV